MYAVETDNLTKYYSKGKVTALENFSIRIEKGKITSILGPNGAGKTTFIKILLGIVYPTRGWAKILNYSIKKPKIHKKIGYLAENHHFPEFLNAEKILYYYGTMSEMDSSIIKNKILQLLRLVKLTGWEKTKIGKYSKGMLQRLGIAQALINDPELLILDEPTDGIDPVGRKDVRDILDDLRRQGRSIILNSHLLSEVERISDEVIILNNGRLQQRGNVQDLISVKDQFQINLDSPSNNITEICQRLNITLNMQNGAYLISTDNREHLNRFIDEIRKNNILINSIIPRKITLEDYFIEVIEGNEWIL